ncbi:hypothetical protein H5410_061162, partial [Solanum commersonii]
AICEMNSQNRKKQKWRHRMGPINFARVRVALLKTTAKNHQSLKCLLQLVPREERKSRVIPKLH